MTEEDLDLANRVAEREWVVLEREFRTLFDRAKIRGRIIYGESKRGIKAELVLQAIKERFVERRIWELDGEWRNGK